MRLYPILKQQQSSISENLWNIALKVDEHVRITPEEALLLYKEANISLLALLSNYVREFKNRNYVYYNRNIHIEPTNRCKYKCKFCSYSDTASGILWEQTHDEIIDTIRNAGARISEVHIVGGVDIQHDIYYYGDLLRKIKADFPALHIKAFTAVELDFMFRQSDLSIKEGIKFLISCGLDSVPGGGAEIFDEKLRAEICPEKTSSQRWLDIHEALHYQGINSNATILYGHYETYEHRVDHLNRLRNLQDRTRGFKAFIPLKFRNKNNFMSDLQEVSLLEDLRNFAVTRIFLDNIDHIKAYWPMLGKQSAQLALGFGVDDFDGTINDSTKIYSMAGAEETSPSMTSQEMMQLIKSANRLPVERDTHYNVIKAG